MHFEPPALPHSVKEFAAHYVMIVVSILTALGLEASIEYLQHDRAATDARRAIEIELRANLKALRSSHANNLKQLQPLEGLCDLLIKDFDNGTPIAQIKQQVADHVKTGINFSVIYPTLRHEAWDVAVANQSASHIEPEVLRRLSAAYAAQRDFNPSNLGALINLPAYVNALTDARIGADDPRDFLHAMRQATIVENVANNEFIELEDDLQRALPDDLRPPGSAASQSVVAIPARGTSSRLSH